MDFIGVLSSDYNTSQIIHNFILYCHSKYKGVTHENVKNSIFLDFPNDQWCHKCSRYGDREQGALIGAGAMLLLGNMLGAGQQTHYVEGPVYYESPRTTVVYREPYYTPPRVIYVNPSRHRPSHYYDHRPQYDHGHRHYR